MRKKSLIRFVLMFLFIFLFFKTSWAGLIIEKEFTFKVNGPQVEKQKTVTYFQNNKVKTVQGNGSFVIIDLNKGTMAIVNPAKREYSLQKIEEIMASMEKGMEQIKAQFKGLPPEQRAMIEKMMGISADKPKSNLKIKDTGERKKIAGFVAEHYVIMDGKTKVGDYWVSRELRELIKKEISEKKIDEFEKAMEGMSKKMDMFGGSDISRLIDLEQELNKKGEIVKQVHHPGKFKMVGRDMEEIVKVEKKDIPSSFFEIPKGFKRVPGFEGGPKTK